MACTIDNGYVFPCDDNFYCQYACESGYHSPDQGWDMVFCDVSSGKWLKPGSHSLPCVKAPTTQPLTARHETDDVHNYVLVISTSVTGSIVGLVLLFVFLRFCLGVVLRRQLASPPTVAMPPGMANVMEDRGVEELRRERFAREQEDNIRRQNENIREQNVTNSDPNNDNLILRVRRFFKITRNPYGVFRNTPEPPPYDAESFAPPSYEESEGATRVTPAFCEQERELRVDHRQEPPPYYEG